MRSGSGEREWGPVLSTFQLSVARCGLRVASDALLAADCEGHTTRSTQHAARDTGPCPHPGKRAVSTVVQRQRSDRR
jgi:hypothetical protein